MGRDASTTYVLLRARASRASFCRLARGILKWRRHSLQQFICGARRLLTKNGIRVATCLSLAALSACGGSGGSLPPVTSEAGPSPFISIVHLRGYDLSGLTGVQYTIAAKPGSVSKPVHVEYTSQALEARGYLASGTLTVPVFGLYAGYNNQVTIELTRQTGDPTSLEVDIQTADYVDPSGVYTTPTITMRRAPGSSLGFDFMYLKSGLGSPVIVDTDGELRWAAPGVSNSTSSTFVGDSFIIGNATQPIVQRLRLDGELTATSLPESGYVDFDHDIARGKLGLLAEVDLSNDGVEAVESTVIEMRDQTHASVFAGSNLEPTIIEMRDPTHALVLTGWDLGAILSAYMSSHGDDPAAFVRPGKESN